MRQEYIDIASHLGIALGVGSLIGLERTFSGRPAGFRTHALVCVASALLMLVTTYQWLWLDMVPKESIRTDPTRMAQGIMTGIGFLGAGVIFREGLTVRGLTTAASIWMTSAIGILLGIGFYFPGLLAAVITLGTLSLFRVIETRMPTRHYAQHTLRFRREDVISDSGVRLLLRGHHFKIVKMNHQLRGEGKVFEYRMVLQTMDLKNIERLSHSLLAMPTVLEFDLKTMVD